MSYSFEDWQAGQRPPKGWDCADAISDGWSPKQIMDFMRGTVRDWVPPVKKNDEPVDDPVDEPVDEVEPVSEPVAEPVAPRLEPVSVARQSRNITPGIDGLDNLPHVFPPMPFDSEVFVSNVFLTHLEDVCGGPIVKADGKFWAWGPTAWRELPEQRLRLAIHGFDAVEAGEKSKPLKLGKRMIDGILSELGTKTSDPEFFHEPTLGVNARNGVIMVDEKGVIKVRPHNPDDRFRFTIDADFELHTEMHPPEGSMLHRLIYGAFKDDPDAAAKIDLVGEILGAAAFGMATRIKQPKAFIFLGETASNGKSTIAGLLSCLLPAGSVSSIAPASFSDEKRIVHLAGKAANVADELSANAVAGEAFKAAITGNPIEGRDVFKSVISFRPRALHCFTTNVLPRFSGGIDRGLKRRLVVLTFNRTIPDNEIIEDISDRIQRDELDLLLGFAIAGAQRLRRNGGYTMPASSKGAMQEWLLLDPVNEWFDLRIVRTDAEPREGWMRTPKLYEDFKAWALENGYAAQFLPPVNTFSQRLKTMDNVQLQRRSDGMVAAGIKLNGRVIDHDDFF